MLAGTVAFAATTAVHADTAQDAKNAYARFLEEEAYWADRFALEDINGDGIPAGVLQVIPAIRRLNWRILRCMAFAI